MMKFKHFLFAGAMLTLAASCGNSDDPTPNPTPNPGVTTFKGILFSTALTNPEGNTGRCYLQALPEMTSGSYDNKNAIPSGFGTMPMIMDRGNIYALPDYMGNTKAEIVCYNIDAAGKLVRRGVLSIPAGAAACNVVELNSEKAYVSFQNLGTVMVFNPTTMTKLKNIDLNSLSLPNAKVAPASMIIRDGYLYVGLSQFNAQWMPTEPTVSVAMIDTKTDILKKHIVNKTLGLSVATRPIDPNTIFKDENGDIYFVCMGAFGFLPQYPCGIVRIKNGAEEIDPDYCIRLDKTPVAGLSVTNAEYIAATCYAGKGKLYAYLNASKLAPDGATNPYLSITCFPAIIDLRAKTMQKIDNMELSNPQGIAIGKHKNLIVFGSANKKASGFYTYNPVTKEVKGPVFTVQGNPGAFHSFAE